MAETTAATSATESAPPATSSKAGIVRQISNLTNGSGGAKKEAPEGFVVGRLSTKAIETTVAEDYEILELIGEGGYGKVFKAKYKRNGVVYAVKCLRVKNIPEERAARHERELEVFALLSSPYLLELFQSFRREDNLFMVMEYCRYGSVQDYLMNYWTNPAYPERQQVKKMCPDLGAGIPVHEVARLLWQMLAGVNYMHHHRFVHRDIKLDNYLIIRGGDEPEVKLCDFGLAVRLEPGEKATGAMGTVAYMAPEVLGRQKYDFKVDIWGIGICGHYLAVAYSPWGLTDNEEHMIKKILENDRAPWPTDPDLEPLIKLVDEMLTVEQHCRPDARAILVGNKWLKKHGRSGDEGCLDCSIL